MEDIKDLMRRKIINVLKNPERAEKFRIQIPNGMLLYGPRDAASPSSRRSSRRRRGGTISS